MPPEIEFGDLQMCMLPLGSRHLSQKGTLTFSQPKGGKAKHSTDHLYMERIWKSVGQKRK